MKVSKGNKISDFVKGNLILKVFCIRRELISLLFEIITRRAIMELFIGESSVGFDYRYDWLIRFIEVIIIKIYSKYLLFSFFQ